jgi:CsoR family transcriptional regulator, copper-sensing transcriptional repressor
VDHTSSEEKHSCCHDHRSTEDAVVGENEGCHTSSDRRSHHSDKTKQNLVTRLNRVEGQIRGIKGLIEKDTYCDDIITQISATQAALNSVAKILLEGHMRSCVVERIQEGDNEVIDELLTTIHRLMKK